MFSKKDRLKKDAVGVVLQNPDFFFKTPFFVLKAKKNTVLYPRFSVVISKKTEKSAVKRHFLKRTIIKNIQKIEKTPKLDAVLILHPEIKKQPEAEIKKELEKTLNKCIIGE